MAVNDLTGQNIQDTYQKVVQTDGVNLADGTGSALPINWVFPSTYKAFQVLFEVEICKVCSGFSKPIPA